MDLRAQTFTLEGVAASLLLLVAVYTMFQSTVVIAPSWSDYANIQLKQLGYDILRVLDNSNGGNSSLIGMIENTTCSGGYLYTPPEFSSNLTKILDDIKAFGKLEILWVNGSKIEKAVLSDFNKTSTPDAVRVSRFVVVPELNNTCLGINTTKPKVLEVRLTLWRT
ncbi:DUF7288 family protein [Archaeoglobus neptunius]|uniref:DUF7288 family protein n=1 Tax=Archaeoglobus neptunius TaxID=2798580 RepID=UPI0019263161|nr:hypothetical protein [Archaeoglobus neptunius]